MKRWSVLLSCMFATAATSALADPIADFYAGKQMKMIIRTGPGGGYDLYARMLAAHMGKHIPGHPSILPVNMTGGGGIKAATYVAEVAPRDGTILTIVSQGLPVTQALGLSPNFKDDLRKFNWIGNMTSANQVTVVWHTSKTQSFADMMKRETIIGSTGAGSISEQIPAIYANVLGAKVKIVVGYPDGPDVNLAMQRGEVDGRGTNPWASYIAMTPDLVRDKKIIPIVQIGMKKDADLPDVPLLRDFAKTDEQRQILDFISRSVTVGRPIATTPGVPPERVAALRKAFDETLRDPAFLADAKKQRADIDLMTGQELAQLIDDIINAPADIRDKVREAIKPTNVVKAPKEKTKKGAGNEAGKE